MTKIVAQHILKCNTGALFSNTITMCLTMCLQCLSKLRGEQHYKKVSEKIPVYI